MTAQRSLSSKLLPKLLFSKRNSPQMSANELKQILPFTENSPLRNLLIHRVRPRNKLSNYQNTVEINTQMHSKDYQSILGNNTLK